MLYAAPTCIAIRMRPTQAGAPRRSRPRRRITGVRAGLEEMIGGEAVDVGVYTTACTLLFYYYLFF